MNYVKTTIIFIVLFYSIKILNILIKKEIKIIDKKIQLSKVENGILSIKDLKQENYSRFIETILNYLKLQKCTKINILDGGTPQLTNIKAYLNNEAIFISCLQNDKLDSASTIDEHLKPTSRNEIQCFIGRMVLNNCKRGIIINNSTFSKESIKYVDSINSSKCNLSISIINGYTLTKIIRNNICCKEVF